MYFKKPALNNLSQGARLEYLRRIKRIDMDDVTDYFGFGVNDSYKTLHSYENNYRHPSK